jgi:O-antigen/teichoic acid export membrane protein
MGEGDRGAGGSEYRRYLSKATKEAGFTFFGQIFALGFGFVANAVIARLLGADVLGVFVLAWTVVMAVSILTTFGFEGGFVKYISMYVSQGRKAEARSVFAFGIAFGLLAGAVGTVAVILLRRPLAYSFFKEPRLAPALLIIAFAMIPYTVTRLQAAALRALKDMRRSVLGSEIWYRVPRLAVFLLLFYAGFRLLGIVGAVVVACGFSAVATLRFLRARGAFLLGGGPRAAIPRREVLGYSSQMLAETTTAFALIQSGRLVLGYYLSSADVGVYNVVALLASLATLFSFSFNAIFSPMIADVYHRGGVDLMASLLHTITRWIVILTLPMFAWLLVSGDAVLSLFGSEFVRGYAALAILAAAQLFEGAGGTASSCLAMTRYQRYNVYNILVMAVVSVALNVYLVPRAGIVGAAAATGAAIVLVNIARLIEARALLKVFPYDRASLKIAVTAAVLFAVAAAARAWVPVPSGWSWAVATLALSYAVGLGLTVLMGIAREDRLIWSSLFGKLGRRTS